MKIRAPTFLLTGFGPFPGTKVNASARYSNALANLASRRIQRTNFVHATLPTQWTGAPEALLQLRETHQPDAIVHFGVSHRAHAITLERTARNVCEDCEDNSRAKPQARHVIVGAPTQLKSTFPAAEIHSKLRARNVQAELSDDAGAYLCNAILFNSLYAAQDSFGHPNSHAPIIGFVHIPQDLGRLECPLSWRAALEAGLDIVNTCLAHVPKQ